MVGWSSEVKLRGQWHSAEEVAGTDLCSSKVNWYVWESKYILELTGSYMPGESSTGDGADYVSWYHI